MWYKLSYICIINWYTQHVYSGQSYFVFRAEMLFSYDCVVTRLGGPPRNCRSIPGISNRFFWCNAPRQVLGPTQLPHSLESGTKRPVRVVSNFHLCSALCIQGFLLNESWTTLYFLLQLPLVGARANTHTHTHTHCCISHQCTRFSVICHIDCLLYIPASYDTCLNLHEYTLPVWQQQP